MITLNKEIIENNYFKYLGEWIVKNVGFNYDINIDMCMWAPRLQSSMRIRTKTLDTWPKYLGYTVRKKLKFCGFELIIKGRFKLHMGGDFCLWGGIKILSS